MPYSPNVDVGRYTSYTANVKDFGALGDGVSDDTTPITNAINAVNSNGGGNVIFPAGTYITSTQLLYSKIHLIGAGYDATTLKLKNATNADLLQGSTNGYGGTLVSVNSANATGSTGGIYNWSIQNLTLDGNKANQTSGPSYCLRAYAYGFVLLNLRIKNGYSGGLLSDWNGGRNAGNDSMEAQITNVKIHDCNGIGLEWGGPHDSQFANLLIFNNGSHNIHIGPNASAILMTNSHSFASATGNNSVGILIEAGYGQYTNCISEGSDTCNIVLLAGETTWVGGHIFGMGTFSVTGIQFGQNAGGTPYANSAYQSAGLTTAVTVGGNLIQSIFSHNEGTNGALWFVNDGGNNLIQGCFFQNAGNILTGTPSPSTIILTSSNGLTPDGSIGKGGICKLPIKANQALLITDRSNDIVNINTNAKKLELVNGTVLRTYTDGYGTESFSALSDANGTIRFAGDTNATIARRAAGVLAFSGTIALAQSSSAAAITNNGTIAISNIGVARINPAANVTGIQLAGGSFAGQTIIVVNESTFSATFDIAGNSFVANGTSCVISPTTAKAFIWDNGTNLWYPF